MASFIGSSMNLIIILSGIIISLVLIILTIKIAVIKSEISDAIERKNVTSYLNRKTLEIEDSVERDTVTPDTIRGYGTSFSKLISWYDSVAQLISVFPLLGILGTVSGLMSQVGASDIDGMLASLNTALSTTFNGLLWAIGLKVFTTLLPSRMALATEVLLDDYAKKLSNTIALNNITSDQA